VTTPGSINRFLEAIQSAGVPPRVTFEFLKTLGLTSSNDRAVIAVMKAINFLDSNGSPTDRYRRFRDKDQGPKVLAEALREAYSDLFMANTRAHELPSEKLKGIVATKVSKGERVVSEIVATFKALAKAADFTGASENSPQRPPEAEEREDTARRPEAEDNTHQPARKVTQFHYNIQIHLPTTTDITVYNEIFKSLREHLL
jgi:hypothetical protein